MPGRVGRPQRADRAALLDAGALQPAQRRGRGAAGAGARGAGHRPRRRGRLRHQAPDVPRGDRLLAAGQAPAAAGEVDRGPPRAHAHGLPLARALPRRRGRLRRRRRRASPPGPHRRRLRRLFDVAPDRLDGRRHGARHPSGPVPHPQLLGRRVVGLHEQVPARGVPRRLAPCGLLHDRADDGRRRRGRRDRRRRGATAQPRARRRVPLHVRHRHGVRLGFVHRIAGEGARGGGLRRTCGASRRRRGPRVDTSASAWRRTPSRPPTRSRSSRSGARPSRSGSRRARSKSTRRVT